MLDNLQAMAVVIGIVNGIRLAREADKWGLILFGCAMVVGVLFGLLGLFGLNIETGIVVALASSGLYRVGEKVGGLK